MESINNSANLTTIPMTAITNSIIQIPNQANGQTAIATSEIKGPYGSVSDFGVANPASAETEDAAVLIQAARDYAIHRVAELAGSMHQSAPPPIDVTPTEKVFGPIPSQKSLPAKNNGGGNKPISPKQSKFVQQLCQQRGVSPEGICGRTLENMTGADANAIIKKLTS